MDDITKLMQNFPQYATFFEEHKEELSQILSDIATDNYFPKDILKMFRFCNVKEVRCVLVGMEPYASFRAKDNMIIPAATGRSFEVAFVDDWQSKYKQASLRNIYKSLYFLKTGNIKTMEEIRHSDFALLPPHQWFDTMEKEGVMFLNASLSVRANETGSHMALWDNFMTQMVRFISQQYPHAKWILAGADAQKRFEDILPKENIIACSHPRLSKFVKECPFKETSVQWVKEVI